MDLNESEGYKKLESYCYNYASKYDYFDDNWLDFGLIPERNYPSIAMLVMSFSKSIQTIEQKYQEYYYFVYLKEYMSKGVVAHLRIY